MLMGFYCGVIVVIWIFVTAKENKQKAQTTKQAKAQQSKSRIHKRLTKQTNIKLLLLSEGYTINVI